MVFIAIVAAVLLTVAVAGGRWRYALAPFRIRPDRMTVSRLGLDVHEPDRRARVDAVLKHFAGGFNAAITAPSDDGWRRHCDGLPVLYRPFAEEGVAMGYTLRHAFRFRPDAFENDIVRPRPEYRYLYYVGLGFWSGMRRHKAERLTRIVSGLDPMHRYLCFDGFGFKHAFFDYPKNRAALRQLDELEGYARNAAYQGVGRAFFFLFLDRPERMIEHTAALGAHAEDAAGGLGLASVFVFPDRLEVARALGRRLPEAWRPPFHLGMCFGLKARSINDRDRFEADVSRLDPAVQESVWASIRECDRVELLERTAQDDDGYRRWRARVTDWLGRHVSFPMSGLKAPAAVEADSQRAPSA